jgi:hypothetical protein
LSARLTQLPEGSAFASVCCSDWQPTEKAKAKRQKKIVAVLGIFPFSFSFALFAVQLPR